MIHVDPKECGALRCAPLSSSTLYLDTYMTKLIALAVIAAGVLAADSAEILEGAAFEAPADVAEDLLTKGQAQLADAPLSAASSPAKVARLTKEIDSSKRSLEEKSTAFEEAEADLKAADITSPVDGIFLSSAVEAGDEVSRDMAELFQIAVDLSRMQVTLEPTPPQLAKMKVGMAAQVFMAEANGEALPGAISAIEDNQVTVVFQSPTAAIKPGLTAQVRIKLP